MQNAAPANGAGAGASNQAGSTVPSAPHNTQSRPQGHQLCCPCRECTSDRIERGPLPGEEALYRFQMASKLVTDDAKEAGILAAEGAAIPEDVRTK